jgi:ferredoxin
MARINPDFKDELHKYGAIDLNACYNCGNCTAVCSLSTEENSFPREMVRYSVLGAESKITSSLKPWLCYYCGECSDTCPQEANPGELMMGLRRYLTAKYDWTGLSGLLYKSLPVSMIIFIITAALVILFGINKNFNHEQIMHSGHLFEMLAIAGVFVIILIPNIIHMWYLTIANNGYKVSVLAYLKGLDDLFVHMFTQKRTLGCDDNQVRWFEHLVLVFGYLSLLFTTVVLDWFSTESAFVIILGYVESVVVFILTFDFVLSRIKKKKRISKHSQPSDWFFVIWLMLMGLTAFGVRLMIDTNLIVSNFWMYMLHLIILVQWALIIVPFGKWTHFLYRSFAMYFERLKNYSAQ